MRLIYKIKINRGFSLLELVLAIGIFALSSVALVTLLIDSNISTKLGLERTTALMYAKEGMIAVQSIQSNGWASLVVGNDYYLANNNDGWSFTGTPGLLEDKYSRKINISLTYPPATSTKTVDVNVSWNLTPVRIASTTLTTILTNWRNN